MKVMGNFVFVSGRVIFFRFLFYFIGSVMRGFRCIVCRCFFRIDVLESGGRVVFFCGRVGGSEVWRLVVGVCGCF